MNKTDKTREVLKDLEEESKTLTAELKVARALTEFGCDLKTGADRRNFAIKTHKEGIRQEGVNEGTLKGLKIQWESLKEMSNSMASYLK